MVEIARAVHHKARIFIFDEPTATLTPEERQRFFALIETLKKQTAPIIFISHALEEALTIADRIAVPREGQLIVADDAKTFTRERIIQAMVGRQLTSELYAEDTTRTQVRKRGEAICAIRTSAAPPAQRSGDEPRKVSWMEVLIPLAARVRSGPHAGDGSDALNAAQRDCTAQQPRTMVRPSFDRARATHNAEYAVCSDPDLAQLDLALASAYNARLIML